MRIIVFGATGRTGREIVRQAAVQGHEIAAFVRHPARLPAGVALEAIEGDVFNAEQVADAIAGRQAVLSALGANHLKRSQLLEKAMKNIVAGMKLHSVSRLIVLGAAGTAPGAGRYQTGLTNLIFWTARHTVLRHPYQSQAAQERVIASSGLDYTIVRPTRFTDGPLTRRYRVLPDALPSHGLRISRADVAHFMLLELTDPRFHRQGPYIAD